jgi:hypothetical protein
VGVGLGQQGVGPLDGVHRTGAGYEPQRLVEGDDCTSAWGVWPNKVVSIWSPFPPRPVAHMGDTRSSRGRAQSMAPLVEQRDHTVGTESTGEL